MHSSAIWQSTRLTGVSREGISYQNVSQCSIPGTWGFRPWGFHSSEPYKEASERLITGYPGPDSPEGGHLWKALKPIDHRRRWALGKGIVKILLQKQRACSAFYLGSNSLEVLILWHGRLSATTHTDLTLRLCSTMFVKLGLGLQPSRFTNFRKHQVRDCTNIVFEGRMPWSLYTREWGTME